jgi:hypothetical protein
MKYKNVSGFKQIAVINGKKEIIPNGVIIEVDREFMHPGFDKVDDGIETTFKKLVPKLAKTNDAVGSLQTKMEELSKDTKNLTDEIINKKIAEYCEKNFSTVFKRLEILKQAIQTIELEVDRALYGEEETDSKS